MSDKTCNIKWLLLVSGLLFLGGCDSRRDAKGWEYAPDMYHSLAYETYTENPVFSDGQTLQTPPEGTIPVGFTPDNFEKTEANRILTGKTMRNPLILTEENTARGATVYTAYCAGCHGETGDGNGHLYSSKRYPYPPASLLSEKVRSNPDGELYHVISAGYGVMAPHASMIRPEDRWKSILYIREELQQVK